MRILVNLVLVCFVASGQTKPEPPESPFEFEVASIRPVAQTTPSMLNVGLHIDGAQVRCTYLSLKDYLAMAYRMKNYQISGPDWMASDRFDINAKLPDGATRQEVPDMLKTLLDTRFRITLHRETKPLAVYALTVAKGGMKVSPVVEGESDAEPDPSGIDVKVTGSREGVSLNLGKGSSFGFGNNQLRAKRITMTGLADMLARFMDRPVLDMTDLKGSYDFTLDIAPEDYRTMMIRSAITAGVQLPPEALRLLENASDTSLYAALQSVGLKLEPRKAPVEVLVIDHAEKLPTEN
jgi:uncharacterized protein (TIGR03435 family)